MSMRDGKGGGILGKLSLIIADADESYAKGVANYINTNNHDEFQVNCFTRSDAFSSFIRQAGTLDILLVCPEFYDEAQKYDKAKLTVVLSDGILCREYSGCEIINKYQPGEKLISNVLFLYSKCNPGEIHMPNRGKSAKVVGIYSPIGGIGKTTIAVSLSAQCVKQELSAFYLNLEPIQSTGVYFDCSNERNLSYVFYYLKEKNKDLAFRLNGIKSRDPATGVEYFTPPQSGLEFDEISVGELESLIHELKNIGSYYFIFIDMPVNFDIKTVRLLELCDRVVIVAAPDPTAKRRIGIFMQELERLASAKGFRLTDKLIFAINKYNAVNEDEEYDGSGDLISVRCMLPQYTNFAVLQGGKIKINDSAFNNSVNELINLLRDK